jgi:hypothetical protein
MSVGTTCGFLWVAIGFEWNEHQVGLTYVC